MYDVFGNFIIQPIVIECTNQTLTVKGMPFWFEFQADKWKIAGTDITVIEYMGTEEIGLLYLSKAITLELGKRINLTYK